MSDATFPPPRSVRRGLPGPLLAAGLVVLLLVGARVVEAAQLPLPRCLFKLVTGRPCVTCGLTRSLTALSHGEVAQALWWNPLIASLALTSLVSPLVWPLLQRARARLRLVNGCAPAVLLLTAVALNWLHLLRTGR